MRQRAGLARPSAKSYYSAFSGFLVLFVPFVVKSAAARLRVVFPEMAALAPKLLDELVLLPARQKQLCRARAARRRRQKLWYRTASPVGGLFRLSRAGAVAVIIMVIGRWLVFMDKQRARPVIRRE